MSNLRHSVLDTESTKKGTGSGTSVPQSMGGVKTPLPKGYKQTEIGVIPEEWEVTKLVEVTIKMQSGGTPKANNSDYYEGNIPFVKIDDITSSGKYLTKTKSTITEEGLKNSSAWVVPVNSILYSMYASLGFLSINKIPVATNQAIMNIIANENKISTDYLYAYLLSLKDKIDKFIDQTTQKNLNAQKVKNFLIPLPPLPEQQKIAEILSTVDQKIDSIDSKIEETQTLKRGLMQRLLSDGIGHSEFKESEIGRIPAGWEVVELGNVADILDPHPSHRAPKEDSNGFPFIGIGDINEKGDISLAGCRKVSLEDVLEQNNNIQINENDIGFGRVATVGKVVKFKRYDFPFALSPTMALIKSKNIDNGFLYQFLSSEFTKRQFRNFTSGSTRISLGIQNLRKLLISVPSFSEQKQIAEILSTADEKLETLRAKKEAFEILKKGLMQKLLSGEVRV